MKRFSLLVLPLVILFAAGCSRSDKKETTVQPQSTPQVERLKTDSERLQQATANAAREREKEKASQMTPTPTASP